MLDPEALRRKIRAARSFDGLQTEVEWAFATWGPEAFRHELLLHPAALLGTAKGWPLWFSNLLLIAGVIGQGSIIDSFAHYHTPLLISLLRTVNGIFWGGLIGFIIIPVSVILRGLMARTNGQLSGYTGR